ncbi:energy-coupling factor transporter transmembrane component T family protein [Fervidobacterium sp.]
MQEKLILYTSDETIIHRLSGLTKLISFLLLTSAVMYTYDIRVIVGILAFSFFLMRVAKIKFARVKLMFAYVFAFLVVNEIITFLFAPTEGVKIFGTEHLLFYISKNYPVTLEQIFYQTTKFLKYVSVIPLGMIFLFTTNPSELASSLSRIGVNYKIAYSFALTLRYFPDIQRAYTDISLAQQARGIDLSYKAKFKDRFKYALLILIPLIFSSLERVEKISNAMDLRGFGKYKKRTWYTTKKFTSEDYIALVISALILLISIAIGVFVNNGRFYNPFL